METESENRKAREFKIWHRNVLLIVLGYEALGCLTGGTLLVAGPDGSYLDMPVSIMHGAFQDFIVPGTILFGLGILCTLAFYQVLRKSDSDWFVAGVALGGLYAWFIVEITILQELHWLHAMWGLPVLLGFIFLFPLIAVRNDTATTQKTLLACGVISTFWYIVINILVPINHWDYDFASMTISELSAIDAATRISWVVLASLYPLLLAAFGWGIIWSSANRSEWVIGGLIIAYSVFNLYWPPMHQRTVLAKSGGTLTDTLHIAWAMVSLAVMLLIMGFASASFGRRFRIYTYVTLGIFIIFGILIGTESAGLAANRPTPYLGIWERINIGAFMLWVTMLSLTMLRKLARAINR